MITILNSLNKTIVTLDGKLKARVFVVENEGKEKDEEMMEEDIVIDITQRHLDQSCLKN